MTPFSLLREFGAALESCARKGKSVSLRVRAKRGRYLFLQVGDLKKRSWEKKPPLPRRKMHMICVFSFSLLHFHVTQLNGNHLLK